MSLEMRPECERCGVLLPHEADARICSYECTFCPLCAEDMLWCPNCGGELVPRPRRPLEKLAAYPPSSERVLKPQGCRH